MRKWLFMVLAGYIWKKVTAKGAATMSPDTVATARNASLSRRGRDSAPR